jgi:hypothetical protein
MVSHNFKSTFLTIALIASHTFVACPAIFHGQMYFDVTTPVLWDIISLVQTLYDSGLQTSKIDLRQFQSVFHHGAVHS